MSNVFKISVALTTEMNELVQQAVASGEYATTSEVIREALREWKHRRVDRAKLQQLWAEGIESGPGRFDNMEAIKREARRRVEANPPKTD
jgi:antitoxin ParD1/3/4